MESPRITSRMMDWGEDALRLGLWYLEGLRVVLFGMVLVDTNTKIFSLKKQHSQFCLLKVSKKWEKRPCSTAELCLSIGWSHVTTSN